MYGTTKNGIEYFRIGRVLYPMKWYGSDKLCLR
ncbi:hypothetical protein IKE_00902 [Bacillus cereus VD196]|uniref:Uncharacterized protein n=1 Tax=Bacillus cereus VD196 TaxID=1053243 RepID=A0A9W5Q7D4_BACCE|nr:hypothetical protein IKE_00902 [Bacillus cereus VD196]